MENQSTLLKAGLSLLITVSLIITVMAIVGVTDSLKRDIMLDIANRNAQADVVSLVDLCDYADSVPVTTIYLSLRTCELPIKNLDARIDGHTVNTVEGLLPYMNSEAVVNIVEVSETGIEVVIR